MKRIRYLSFLLVLLASTAGWAQDDFDPTDPAEPGGPLTRKTSLTLVANPASAAYSLSGGGKYEAGHQVNISLGVNSSYRFVSWTNENGEIVSAIASFTYIKGEEAETLTANFEFDPNAPGEPDELEKNVKHWLRIVAEEGAGSISQSARYMPGTSVTVSATPKPSYTFAGWYDKDGNLVGDGNSTYTLTMPAAEVTLTAKFDFTPDSPDEPGLLKVKHILTLAAEEGGTVSADAYKLEEGESTTIRASVNTGFEFVGWYKNNQLYTESPEFVYEMGSTNIAFTARFSFNPNSPNEPDQIEEKKYAFYMLNVINKPGATVQFPIYLTTREEAKDMTFQLTFPDILLPDMESFAVSEATEGYTIDYTNGEAGEGRTAYVFNMSAGEHSIPVGNTVILTFNVTIPTDIETAKAYPITINQVSVADTDNNSQHAGTKNGRISVYKNGDTNGDNAVNVVDVANTISCILGETPDDYITVAGDINDDNNINIVDVASTIDIILDDGNEPSAAPLKTQGIDPD